MNAVLVYALWAISGGAVKAGYAVSFPEPIAYFETAEECVRVQDLVKRLDRHKEASFQCIQARYIIPGGTNVK